MMRSVAFIWLLHGAVERPQRGIGLVAPLEVVSMSRLRVFFVPVLALALLALMRVAIVGAAPPAVPLMGVTVTPTFTVTPPVTIELNSPCDPIIRKQVSPSVASPGDEVVFTITMVNVGRDAAVDAYVLDNVPDYLEILEVTVKPRDQGQELLPRKGQMVVVDVGTLGQDFVVEVMIRARVREDAPAPVCIENVAEFRAPNCPNRSAEVLCWELPESGEQHISWMLPTGAVAMALGLGLALATRKRV